MREDSGAGRTGQGDLLEFLAPDFGDAVVPRQPFIHEAVISGQQFQDAAILADEEVDEMLRLLLHRCAQFVVELGKQGRVWSALGQRPCLQPLPAEIFGQRPGARIPEHAANLLD